MKTKLMTSEEDYPPLNFSLFFLPQFLLKWHTTNSLPTRNPFFIILPVPKFELSSLQVGTSSGNSRPGPAVGRRHRALGLRAKRPRGKETGGLHLPKGGQPGAVMLDCYNG